MGINWVLILSSEAHVSFYLNFGQFHNLDVVATVSIVLKDIWQDFGFVFYRRGEAESSQNRSSTESLGQGPWQRGVKLAEEMGSVRAGLAK